MTDVATTTPKAAAAPSALGIQDFVVRLEAALKQADAVLAPALRVRLATESAVYLISADGLRLAVERLDDAYIAVEAEDRAGFDCPRQGQRAMRVRVLEPKNGDACAREVARAVIRVTKAAAPEWRKITEAARAKADAKAGTIKCAEELVSILRQREAAPGKFEHDIDVSAFHEDVVEVDIVLDGDKMAGFQCRLDGTISIRINEVSPDTAQCVAAVLGPLVKLRVIEPEQEEKLDA